MLTLGIARIVFWVRSIATRYELTTQRVRIERGVFSKILDSVELFRIDHFDIHNPLGMRLLGHAVLHPLSSGANLPAERRLIKPGSRSNRVLSGLAGAAAGARQRRPAASPCLQRGSSLRCDFALPAQSAPEPRPTAPWPPA